MYQLIHLLIFNIMDPLIGSIVRIIGNSRPNSFLWNSDGHMNPTIGRIGQVINKSETLRSTGSKEYAHTYEVKFNDESLNPSAGYCWHYFASDFEVISGTQGPETVITF